MPRTVLKVHGGGWWLRPILVFSLSLDQAEQQMVETESNRAQIIDFREANIYLISFWC